MKTRGFTLIELVVAIIIGAVLAAVIAVFMRPSFDAYAATRSRSELATLAAVAIQRISRDVALAVPNSIRMHGSLCFDVVPSSASGRVRMAPDILNAGSAALDTTQPTAQLDLLTELAPLPAAGTWLVLGNQTAGDLYSGATRVAIASATAPPNSGFGKVRLSFDPAFQFPQGFASGRFQLVPAAQGVVSYVCARVIGGRSNTSYDLWRVSGQAFDPNSTASCPRNSGGQHIATGLSACSFTYDPGPTATQQFGLLTLQFSLSRNGEAATLVDSIQVLNKTMNPRQHGFGMIGIVVVLVLLSALGAAITRMSRSAHQAVDQELMAARADQAARAGAQWGLYQALKGSWIACSGATQTLDLRADFGTWVSVTCQSQLFNEGADPLNTAQPVRLRITTIQAVACNADSQCPDDARAQQPNYVERSITVRVTN